MGFRTNHFSLIFQSHLLERKTTSCQALALQTKRLQRFTHQILDPGMKHFVGFFCKMSKSKL